MTKERFLTARWNNWLSLGLGLPALVYVGVALTTTALSVSASFTGMVIIGVMY